MKISLAAILGLSLAAAAQAQTGTIHQLFAFTCSGVSNEKCPQGARPDLIMQASDGNFYGGAQVTDEGVSDPQGGTLFKLTPAGKFTKLFTFAANSGGQFLNGNNPVNGFAEANDGFLYGTTFNGGKQNDGVLFRISKTGTGFKVLHNFCSAANCADGSIPNGLCWDRTATFTGPHCRADQPLAYAQISAAAPSSVSSRRPALLPFSIDWLPSLMAFSHWG